MSKRDRKGGQSPAGTGKPHRVDVYVDELQPPQARREELSEILAGLTKSKVKFDNLIIFGARRTDMNDAAKDMAAVLKERGISVAFSHEISDL